VWTADEVIEAGPVDLRGGSACLWPGDISGRHTARLTTSRVGQGLCQRPKGAAAMRQHTPGRARERKLCEGPPPAPSGKIPGRSRRRLLTEPGAITRPQCPSGRRSPVGQATMEPCGTTPADHPRPHRIKQLGRCCARSRLPRQQRRNSPGLTASATTREGCHRRPRADGTEATAFA